MFRLHPTSTWNIRAGGRARYAGIPEFKHINRAIAALRASRWPTVICFRDPKYGTNRTLMVWEGEPNQFARRAKTGVTQIARCFYIPKGLLRKTSRRRTRK